jgi:hypothetical protein
MPSVPQPASIEIGDIVGLTGRTPRYIIREILPDGKHAVCERAVLPERGLPSFDNFHQFSLHPTFKHCRLRGLHLLWPVCASPQSIENIVTERIGHNCFSLRHETPRPLAGCRHGRAWAWRRSSQLRRVSPLPRV